MLATNSNPNLPQARKLLWAFMLIFAAGSFGYNWYQDRQIIRQFSADGIVIKVLPASSDKAALIDVFNKDGQLRRLTHKDLVLPEGIRAGDQLQKNAGSVSALLNQKEVLLQQ